MKQVMSFLSVLFALVFSLVATQFALVTVDALMMKDVICLCVLGVLSVGLITFVMVSYKVGRETRKPGLEDCWTTIELIVRPIAFVSYAVPFMGVGYYFYEQSNLLGTVTAVFIALALLWRGVEYIDELVKIKKFNKANPTPVRVKATINGYDRGITTVDGHCTGAQLEGLFQTAVYSWASAQHKDWTVEIKNLTPDLRREIYRTISF